MGLSGLSIEPLSFINQMMRAASKVRI